jgi:hypothetical protein
MGEQSRTMPTRKKELQMLRTATPFLTTMLLAVLAPIFIVMATAFITIPHSLGGHPGEVRLASSSATTFHPT